MAKSKGLGKGLEALMGSAALPELRDGDRLEAIDINLIDPNPDQPRKVFDQAKLAELAASIAQVGVISPIIVLEKAGRYMIVAGERRWRASRIAGLTEIPAVVRTYTDVRRMEIALIENLQRDDLNPIDAALGIRSLIEECALTQDEAAQRLGKSRPAVANLLRLLALDEATIELVRSDRLSEGHARALLPIKDNELRRAAAEKTLQLSWSVRQLEGYVRNLLARQESEDAEAEPPAKRAPEISAVERSMRRATGLRVKAKGTQKRGSVTFYYGSFEELERLYHALGGTDEG